MSVVIGPALAFSSEPMPAGTMALPAPTVALYTLTEFPLPIPGVVNLTARLLVGTVTDPDLLEIDSTEEALDTAYDLLDVAAGL
jgi:hypothetical protein